MDDTRHERYMSLDVSFHVSSGTDSKKTLVVSCQGLMRMPIKEVLEEVKHKRRLFQRDKHLETIIVNQVKQSPKERVVQRWRSMQPSSA